ncbi:hypothetical protein BJX99DRAFT_257159 [Aspergillus californicus]
MPNNTRTCFFPSGAVAPGNVACSSDEYTSCCGIDDLCLSNGLCLAVSHQPYVLSRGACTDPEWGSGCPQYCRDDNPAGGCSIVNLVFYEGVSTYCCGTPIASNLTSNLTTICPDNGSAFEVPTAQALVGYAMLSNISTLDAVNTTTTVDADSTTSCTTNGSCHSTAIGAGIGVPLGVIALASLAWAFLERRRASAASASASAASASASAASAALSAASPTATGEDAKSSGHSPVIELPGRPPYVGELDASNRSELSSH